jgi:predicted RNA-binding protein with EMAP domain
MYNQIDKKLEAHIVKNLESEYQKLDNKRLADLEAAEFNIMQDLADTIKDDFEKEKKSGQSFLDFLKSKDDDYFKTIKLKDGGKVIQFSDYFKSKEPKIKELDLASHFKFGKTIASLTDAEREVVNNLLKMSLGKKD